MSDTSGTIPKIYQIDIGLRDEGDYMAAIVSPIDNKTNVVVAPNLKVLLAEVVKRVRKHRRNVKNFPLPGESKILQLSPPKIIGPRIIIPE